MAQPVHSVLFDQGDYYDGAASGAQPHVPSDNLSFYPSAYGETAQADAYPPPAAGNYYPTAHGGNIGPQAGYNGGAAGGSLAGAGWLVALGTGAYPGEPPLLEELGINFGHIKSKSFAVLNPMQTIDKNLMDDTDLAGPLLFYLLFGILLLASGKVHFGYIYGVAVLGCLGIHGILSLMAPSGADAYRTASVLGYSLMPMVLLAAISAVVPLTGYVGGAAATLAVSWCTVAASGIFAAVMGMSDQRVLVAYPVCLLYTSFALMTVF